MATQFGDETHYIVHHANNSLAFSSRFGFCFPSLFFCCFSRAPLFFVLPHSRGKSASIRIYICSSSNSNNNINKNNSKNTFHRAIVPSSKSACAISLLVVRRVKRQTFCETTSQSLRYACAGKWQIAPTARTPREKANERYEMKRRERTKKKTFRIMAKVMFAPHD